MVGAVDLDGVKEKTPVAEVVALVVATGLNTKPCVLGELVSVVLGSGLNAKP